MCVGGVWVCLLVGVCVSASVCVCVCVCVCWPSPDQASVELLPHGAPRGLSGSNSSWLHLSELLPLLLLSDLQLLLLLLLSDLQLLLLLLLSLTYSSSSCSSL